MKISSSKKIANADRGGERFAKARVYFFFNQCSTAPVEGTNLGQAFANRRNQPWRDYRKLLPEVVAQFPELANTGFKWSQHAGCSCPCSPGFKADRMTGFSYYIHVE